MQWLHKHGDSLLASIAGFILIYLFTAHGGIGISPDSVCYASTARNLVAGKGFVFFGDQPLVAFPLFYPLFLAAVMNLTGLDIIQCAPLLNGLMFALVILLSGIMMEKFTYQTKWYKIILLCIITVSPALIEIYSMLWSETLFILLSMLFFFSIHKYLVEPKIKLLILPAVIAAIAFDTRYAGITLVATGSMLVFLHTEIGKNDKLKQILAFLAIANSLVILNLIHNALISKFLTGQRQKGITPLADNISYSGDVFSDWTFYWVENHFLKIAFCVAVILFFLWHFHKNWRLKIRYATYENIVIAFFIVYTSFIIISSTISRYEQINNRLLSPAFLPFLWGISHLVPAMIKKTKVKKYKWVVASIFSAIVIAIGYGYYNINTENYSFMSESGIPGYTEDEWKESPTISFLQQKRNYTNPDLSVYSNHNQAVYLYTNSAVDALPEKAYKTDVDMFMAESPIILIWFKNETNNDLLSLNDIQHHKDVRVLHSFPDGVIYKLTNKDKTIHHHRKKKSKLRLFRERIRKSKLAEQDSVRKY